VGPAAATKAGGAVWLARIRQPGQFAPEKTTARNILRNFSTFKAQAQRGGTGRIRDHDGEFLFFAANGRRSLVGSARGKIRFAGDLTGPTLPEYLWQPTR
jgi:hypothetical protein